MPPGDVLVAILLLVAAIPLLVGTVVYFRLRGIADPFSRADFEIPAPDPTPGEPPPAADG